MTVKNQLSRLVVFSCVLINAFLCSADVYAEEKTESAADPDKRAFSLIEIYTRTNALPNDLIDLKKTIDNMFDVWKLEERVPEIRKQIADMEWQATELKSNPNLTFHDLTLFESKLSKIKGNITDINTPVLDTIKLLEASYKEWVARGEELKTYEKVAEDDPEMEKVFLDLESGRQIVETAKKLIEDQLRPSLVFGRDIAKIQTRLYTLSETASSLINEMNATGIQQTSPSMLSADFYKPINKDHFVRGWESVRLFVVYQWGYLKQNIKSVCIGIFLILLLAVFIHLSKSAAKVSMKWHAFASRPVASSTFILSSFFSFFLMLSLNITLPPDWVTLQYLPLLAAVGFLLPEICSVKWQVTLLRQLLLIILLTLVFTVISLPRILFYLFVFYTSIVLLLVYCVRFLRQWLVSGRKKITWAISVWGVFPLVIIIAGISGYDQLAVGLFGRVVSLILATLVIWLMALFFRAFVEMLLSVVPWKIIGNNYSTITTQIHPFIILGHAVLWLATSMTVLWISPTLDAAFNSLMSLQFSIYSLKITPGSILMIVIVVYMTLMVSKGIRAFLMQEVLPCHGVEKGTQISVTRLVHYAVLCVGILVLLRMLGFGLNQIAIVGGALGVGIGFGLQAIVNNFVSGLIMLFERPVKIGDVIEVDNQVGEVRELGLRATIVQTFDNSEIVIPNSQLITGSVINWTLAEKKVRVRVPVGVAYGSDIQAVINILLACAENNALVLGTPRPVALFLSFGASSLDFELRVWINDFNDKLTVLSELNQDIESEFGTAGIEIPFPQSDLHVRSIDESVINLVNRKSS